jgi:hypothetical protein
VMTITAAFAAGGSLVMPITAVADSAPGAE